MAQWKTVEKIYNKMGKFIVYYFYVDDDAG